MSRPFAFVIFFGTALLFRSSVFSAEGTKAAPSPTPTASPTALRAKVDPKASNLASDTPTVVIQKYTEELKSIVRLDQRTKKGVRNEDKEAKLAEKVREFFDFQGLARMSLGAHWNTLKIDQRTDFSSVFVSLVEDSYIRRSRNIMGDYDLKYGKEDTKKTKAKVRVTVIRNDANVEIIYELHRVDGKWMIYNITLDDVDLVSNYQSQFNQIIKQHSFNYLMKRMREKQKEMAKKDATDVNL